MAQQRREIIGLYDYIARSGEELAFTKGERMRLLEQDSSKLEAKNWWSAENEQGKSGFVPKNYVQLAKARGRTGCRRCCRRRRPRGTDARSWKQDSQMRPKSNAAPPATTGPAQAPMDGASRRASSAQAGLCSARAKFNYQALNADELTLRKGDVVSVLEKGADSWWRGTLGQGQSGWFPSNYVEVIPSANPPMQEYEVPPEGMFEASSATTKKADVLLYVRCEYDFNTSSNEELPFKKGDVLEIIEQSENDWWMGRNASGQTGFIPRAYVKECQPPATNADQAQRTAASPVSKGPSSVNPLARHSWYHGRISRAKGEELLANANPGVYLVRESESHAGDYSISLKTAVRIMHFKVMFENGEYNIGKRSFRSLVRRRRRWCRRPRGGLLNAAGAQEELIDFYSKNCIYTTADGAQVFLEWPLGRK